MNATGRQPRHWGSLLSLLAGLLLLSGPLLASGNGLPPLSLVCPSGQATWLEGTAPPGRALLVRFAGAAVGGGSSDAGGRWRVPLRVSASDGIYPVEVIEREGEEVVAVFTCYVDLPIGATPTGTPTRRSTQPPSPSPTTTTTRTTTATPLSPTAHTETAAPATSTPLPLPTSTSNGEAVPVLPSTPTPTSTSATTNPPTVALVAAQGDDPDDPELFEYVILENQTPEAQNLAGWRLIHGSTGQGYTLPAVTLLPGEQLVIWSGEGEDELTSGSLFWPAQSPRWAEGDTAELHDAGGQVVSTLLVQSPERDEE